MKEDYTINKPGFYSMTYHCSNCGKSFIQTFKKGERAYQGVCSNCGVEPKNDKLPEWIKHKL